MPTTLTSLDVATDKSDHVAVGPPAVSLIPPPSPATPTGVPSPFVYIAKATAAKRCSSKMKLNNGQARCMVKNSYMDIEKPGNMPAAGLPIKDIVSHAHIAKAKMVNATGENRLTTQDKPVVVTGDTVKMNVLTQDMELAQSVGPLLDGGGYTAALADYTKANVTIITAAEPVAVANGAVVDGAVDLRLPGVIPLTFRRFYLSTHCKRTTAFGRGGWSHNLAQSLESHGDELVLHQEAAEVTFARPEVGASTFHRGKRLELTRLSTDVYEVFDLGARLVRRFSPLEKHGRPMLREIRDRFGNHIDLAYEEGVLAEVIDTARRRLRLSHEAGRLVLATLSVDGRVWRTSKYTYDEDGNLATATDPDGFTEFYAYDGLHRLVQKRRKNGVRFHYKYDKETGCCVRAWGDGNLHSYEFIYDLSARTTVAHGNPQPREFTYDEKGAIIRESTFDEALVDERTFDDDGYLLERKNAAGEAEHFEYDARGNRTKHVDPAGNATTFFYVDDLLVQRADPDGAVTTYEWDAYGSLVAATDPAGNRTTLAYDGLGRLVAIYGPRGMVRSWEWNDRHDVVREADGAGRSYANGFDAVGNLITRWEGPAGAEPGADGRIFRHEYDARGNLVSFRYPTGEGLSLEYDGLACVTRTTDHLGRVATMKYAGLGNLVEMTTAVGETWHFTYDVNEKLRTVKNPKGEVYEYKYDRAGRVIEEIPFDGRVIRRTYNKTGLVARIEHSDGTFRAFTYDPNGHVLIDASPHGTRKFERDDWGYLLKATVEEHDGKVVVEYERDAFGRMIAQSQDGHTIRWAFDDKGNRVARTMPNGVTTHYTYDLRHAMTAVEHAGHRIDIERDALGLEVERRIPAGNVVIRQAYDAIHRWIDQSVLRRGPTGDEVLSHRHWTWGVDGLLSVLQDQRWGTNELLHDELYRLLEIRHPQARTERYEYDPAGSVRRVGSLDDTSGPWTLRAGNVLVRTDLAEYENDPGRRRVKKLALENGRPRPGTDTVYIWDCRDQLREVRLPSGETVSFTYDAFGRRVKKEIVPPPLPLGDHPRPPPPARIVRYLWDGDALAAEIDSEHGTRVFVHEPYTLNPLFQEEQGEVFTYVNDFLGTPRDLLDAAGRVAWSGTYTAFGEIAGAMVDPRALFVRKRPVEPAFRMLGQYWDEETELGCSRFRYYDPKTARWLSPDPVGLLGGTNLFAFGANPAVGVDPLGLAPCAGHGYIQFHTSDGTPTGKPTGVTATITPAMIGTGSSAEGRIRPDGWDGMPSDNRGRGHVLGNQLGGPGDLPANLVSLYQNPVNTPIMRDLETSVRNSVDGGATVNYNVTVNYGTPAPAPGAPSSVTMSATDAGTGAPVFPSGNTTETVNNVVP